MRVSSISFKVACGYLLTFVLLFAAIYYVYYNSRQITETTRAEQEIAMRRKLTDKLTINILSAETLGQTATIGDDEAMKMYEVSVGDVFASIGALDSVTSDSVMSGRLDTLSVLVEKKKNNVVALAAALKNNEGARQYYKQLDKMIRDYDSLTDKSQTVQQIIKQETSYVVSAPRRNFFKRVADVFNPGELDTVDVKRTVGVVEVDTFSVGNDAGDTSRHIPMMTYYLNKGLFVWLSEQKQRLSPPLIFVY